MAYTSTFRNSLLIFIFLSVSASQIYCQYEQYGRNAIKVGMGFGANGGRQEQGVGLVYLLGWQRALGEAGRLRLNPHIMIGGFQNPILSDEQKQFYRITSVGLNLHYDLIRYKLLALVVSGGGFGNYSRGLFTKPAEHFMHYYVGANASMAFRIETKRRFAFEIRPANVQFGNDDFMTLFFMTNVDIRLGSHKP